MEYCEKSFMCGAYERYKKSNKTTLSECYAVCSDGKKSAYEYCVKLASRFNGKNLRIISYNNQMFTVGFIGYIDGLKAFFYITRDYDRFIYIK